MRLWSESDLHLGIFIVLIAFHKEACSASFCSVGYIARWILYAVNTDLYKVPDAVPPIHAV